MAHIPPVQNENSKFNEALIYLSDEKWYQIEWNSWGKKCVHKKTIWMFCMNTFLLNFLHFMLWFNVNKSTYTKKTIRP